VLCIIVLFTIWYAWVLLYSCTVCCTMTFLRCWRSSTFWVKKSANPGYAYDDEWINMGGHRSFFMVRQIRVLGTRISQRSPGWTCGEVWEWSPYKPTTGCEDNAYTMRLYWAFCNAKITLQLYNISRGRGQVSRVLVPSPAHVCERACDYKCDFRGVRFSVSPAFTQRLKLYWCYLSHDCLTQ